MNEDVTTPTRSLIVCLQHCVIVLGPCNLAAVSVSMETNKMTCCHGDNCFVSDVWLQHLCFKKFTKMKKYGNILDLKLMCE